MKKVAILQSNYIPWKGYFDLIHSVDEFIVFDEMQFTKRDWRNRNQIKTPHGLQWLTVPVKVKGKYFQKISETELDETNWQEIHWKSILHNYHRAPYANEILNILEPYYLEKKYIKLAHLNLEIIKEICQYLNIETKITQSSNYYLSHGKTERLLDICLQSGATEYFSGPAAKSYLDVQLFKHKGIQVTWFDYNNYPEYPQLWGKFVHEVSIIDLMFNCGRLSSSYFNRIDIK